MKYSQELENIITFFKAAASDQSFYYCAVGETEKELQDLDHELELAATDAVAIKRLGRERKKVLQTRRQHKDVVECTAPLAAFIAEHPRLLNELSVVLGKIRKVEKYHQTRQYIPRVRTDLTIGNR